MTYISTFYKKFREWFNIILWLMLCVNAGMIIRKYFDPSAQVSDIGALSKILFAGIALMVFKNLAWLLIKTIWPGIAYYFTNSFNQDFQDLQPWQKVVISLSFVCFLVDMMVHALSSF